MPNIGISRSIMIALQAWILISIINLKTDVAALNARLKNQTNTAYEKKYNDPVNRFYSGNFASVHNQDATNNAVNSNTTGNN